MLGNFRAEIMARIFLICGLAHIHISVGTNKIENTNLPSVNLNAVLGENTVAVLRGQKWNSSAFSHTNTDVWFGFVYHISFIATQCNDSAFLILWPSVCEIASSFFDTFKVCAFFSLCCPYLWQMNPPLGSNKVYRLISSHLISSPQLWPRAGEH